MKQEGKSAMTAKNGNGLQPLPASIFTDSKSNVKNWEIKSITSNKEFPFDDIFKIRWNPCINIS